MTYPFIFRAFAKSRRCPSGKITRRRDARGVYARLGHSDLPHALRHKPVARSANVAGRCEAFRLAWLWCGEESPLAGSATAPVDVVEADDVVHAEITADLDLGSAQARTCPDCEAMDAADRDADRLVLVHRSKSFPIGSN